MTQEELITRYKAAIKQFIEQNAPVDKQATAWAEFETHLDHKTSRLQGREKFDEIYLQIFFWIDKEIPLIHRDAKKAEIKAQLRVINELHWKQELEEEFGRKLERK